MSRPIAKDHAKKRTHILKIAARVFAKNGFARAPMALVAKECGISKANIYHYYPSKDVLLFDILDTYLSELRDRIVSLDLARFEPQEQLGVFVVETLRAYEGMDDEHKIQTEGIPLLSDDQQKILKSYQRELVMQLSTIVAGIAPNVFKSDPQKLRATVMSIFGMINWFYMWNSPADQKERDEYSQLVTKLTLNGVRCL